MNIRLQSRCDIVQSIEDATESDSDAISLTSAESSPSAVSPGLSLDEQITDNASKFACVFPRRSATVSNSPGLVHHFKWNRWIPLSSSALGHRLLMPHLYSEEGILWSADCLNNFNKLCVSAREGDTVDATAAFIAKVYPQIESRIHSFGDGFQSEVDIGTWLDCLVYVCSFINSESPRGCGRRKKAVGGVLPFTEEGTTDFHNVNAQVGYYGYTDRTLFRSLPGRKVPFAVCEFQMVGQLGRPWYKAEAILARALCSLCGTEETEVCLVVCEFGWVLLWREVFDEVNEEPISKIFCYSNDGTWIRSVGEDAQAVYGRRILFEVIARISRVSSKQISQEITESIEALCEEKETRGKRKDGTSFEMDLIKKMKLSDSTNDIHRSIKVQDQRGHLHGIFPMDLSGFTPEMEHLMKKVDEKQRRQNERNSRNDVLD